MLFRSTANYRRNVQDRSAGSATGGEGNEDSAAEDSGADDLPADLDLETGELVGTGTGTAGTAGTSEEAGDDLQDVLEGAAAAGAGRGRGRMGG